MQSFNTLPRLAMLFVVKVTLLLAISSGMAHAGCWVYDYYSNGNYSFTGPVFCDPVELIHPGGSSIQKLQDGGGGPGVGIGNRGDHDGKKDPKEDPCHTAGNPIVYSTGNKIEPETDFESRGAAALSLHRTYNNYWDGIGIFGANWLSDFDYKLAFNSSAASGTCYPKPGGTCASPPTSVTTLFAMRPDGRQIKFNFNATQGVWWEDKPGPIARIVRNADGTYTLYGEDHSVERYSATGYVLSVATEQGVGWTFTYDANNYLQRVTQTSGRHVQFTWTNGQLTRVTDPQGNAFNYTYYANRAGTGTNLLRNATLPGTSSTLVTYYYEDSRFPFGLTGKDFNGTRYSTFAYDYAGRATLSKHGSGNTDQYTFSYTEVDGGNSQTVVETNPLGRKTSYQFVNGNITSTTGSGGASCMGTHKTHTYDANGYDNQVTDFNGNITQYSYAANGHLQQKTEAYNTPAARTTTYEWDPDPTRNRLVSITLVGVNKTSYTYDSLARPATVTVQNLSAKGVANQTRTTTYTYATYASGITKTLTVDGPLPGAGDAIVYNFNSLGDLTSTVNGLGQTVSYSAYNALGEPGHIVGANGAVADYTYDAQGRLINERTYPNGVAADTVHTYGGSNLLTAATSKDGVTRNFTYDEARHVIAVGSTLGTAQEEEDYAYDAMSNVTSIAERNQLGHFDLQCDQWWVDGEGYRECTEYVQVWIPAGAVTHSTSRTFDGLGRLWTIGGNNGQNVRTTYDANDNPAVMTDSLDHSTTLTYDAFDRPFKSVDAKGGVTRLAYDAGGRLTRVTDPRGLITSYVYDGFGQLWSQSSPDTGTTTFTYDAYGQRTGMTRADGTTTAYVYDALGRITSIAAGGKTQAFTYDNCTNGKGLLCGASDAQGSLVNTYTPEGWLASQASTVAGVTYTTSYTYDAMGRVTSLTYPNGVVAGYSYVNGKLSAMTVKINGVTSNVVTGLTYLPFGGPKGWSYGNGLVRGNTYDLDGRLTDISTTVPSSGAAVQRLSYGFDANDSITGITNGTVSSGSQNFGYDELTRLTTVTSSGGNWTWDYDADGNRAIQTSAAGSTGYVTATTSNQLSALSGAGARTFGFDVLGNRTSDSRGALSFHFDAFNRMDSSTSAGVTTAYRVNPLGQRTYKATGATWAGFVYAPDSSLLAETGTAGTTDYLWMGNTLVGMVRNNTLYSIHTDHLGRPEMVTAPSRSVVWRASNQAFDRAVTQDSIGGLNIGLPGQYYDVETGLWNNGFRDYDASVGRYVESDPLGLGAGINTFAYVAGDPINSFDPLGLLSKQNCEALAKLVAFDDKQSSALGTLYSKDYHSLSFRDNMLGLNADFPSIGGNVDIDWMLRSAGYGTGRIPGISHAVYGVGKVIWNSVRLHNPLQNISQDGNLNAPAAARMWLSDGKKLAEIFAPALKECACKK